MHPLEILDLIGIAVPRLAVLLLAFAAAWAVAAAVTYSICWNKTTSARTLWELRDSLAWATAFWPLFNNKVAKLAVIWAAWVAVVLTALNYEWWQWPLVTFVVLIMSGVICFSYRLVKNMFLAWSDVEGLVNAKVPSFPFVNEPRMVRSIQEDLL